MSDRKPDWLKIKIQDNKSSAEVRKLIDRYKLHTVCEEANCPNRMECYSKKTATFMILGRECTRNCTFCNVEHGRPSPPDSEEPCKVARAVSEMGLRHAVITSVTRDDLPDGGAYLFAQTISEIRKAVSGITVEVLIPDFRGDENSLQTVIDAGPDIINHNIETVSRLYPEVRPQAVYERSLEVIRRVKKSGSPLLAKSGIMAGLGETEEEVMETISDLAEAGCDILTIGQYLAPSSLHHRVAEYVHPDKFDLYRRKAQEKGFKSVASAPFVRSSYLAETVFADALEIGKKR